MFKIGTRVQVIDEKMAQDYNAKVHKWDKGTVMEIGPHSPFVQMDGDSKGRGWYIPTPALREC